MFAQEDSLPGPQAQPTVAYRNRQRTAEHGCFDVGRHVVGAFNGMHVREFLGGDGIERRFEIVGDVGIGVLVDAQLGGCLQKKDVQ